MASSSSSIVFLFFFFIVLLNFFCIASSTPYLFRNRRSLQSLEDANDPTQNPDLKKIKIKSAYKDSEKQSKSTSTTDKLPKISKSRNSTSTINKSFKLSKSLNSTSTIKKSSKLSNSTSTLNKPSKLSKSHSNSTSTINKSSKLLKSLNISTSTIKKATKLSKSLNNSTTIKNKSKLNMTTSSIITNKPLMKSTDLKSSSSSSSKPLKKLDPTMSWLAEEDDSDFIAEFRELPSRLIPDITKISEKSKVYISRANKEMTKSFKPYIGTKYAATAAAGASAALLCLPLLLLASIFHKLRNYSLSLQRGLVYAHAYLAIYFATLSSTAIFMGLEPMRFFHVSSLPAYVCMQVLHALFFVIYLLAEVVNLAAAITTTKATTAAEKMVAAAQLAVGVAVGVHYYSAVFHRTAAGEPPKTNWRVHAVYAVCFAVICGFSRAVERRKKVYDDGGDDCKTS